MAVTARDRLKAGALIGAGLLAGGLLPGPGRATPLSRWEADGEPFMGRATAPFVLIEYASFTCPHCAAFHREVLPELKRRFIDTGRVRYVFRPMLTSPPELAGALQVTADCAPVARRFDVIAALMDAQASIFQAARAGNGLPAVASISQRAGGADMAGLRACLSQPGRAEAIMAIGEQAESLYGITTTPGLVLNGVKVPDGPDGGHSVASVSAFIEAAERALAARRGP